MEIIHHMTFGHSTFSRSRFTRKKLRIVFSFDRKQCTNLILVVEKVFEWIHLTDGLFQELEKKTRCVLVGLLVWDKFNEATADIYTIPGYAKKVCD